MSDFIVKPLSGSFLYNGTLALFERRGFQRTRRLGKNHWGGDQGRREPGLRGEGMGRDKLHGMFRRLSAAQHDTVFEEFQCKAKTKPS